MKIVSDTDSELVLRHIPYLIIGSMLLFLGAILFALAAKGTTMPTIVVVLMLLVLPLVVVLIVKNLGGRTLRFDFLDGRFEWSFVTMIARTEGSCRLDEIRSIEVEETKDSEGSAYRLVVMTTEKPIPLSEEYFGWFKSMNTLGERIHTRLREQGIDVPWKPKIR